MQVRKIVCLFSVLLIFSMLFGSVDASSDATISFYSDGVTIDLVYPEEAYPAENIWHNVTIRASKAITLQNFTVVIKAPVSSSWQVVFSDKLPGNWPLAANTPFEWPIMTDILPQKTNGKLSCFVYVNTGQSADYSSYNIYTTEVREMTYSELSAKYNVLYNDYYQLGEDYKTLNDTYNILLLDFGVLNASYNELISDYIILNNTFNDLDIRFKTLDRNYKELDSMYDGVNSAHDSLIEDYSELQFDYEVLDSTYYDLNETYYKLQNVYGILNQTYTDLLENLKFLEETVGDQSNNLDVDRIVMFIFTVAVAVLVAFIIYLKRKKQEPYLVIRKETVSLNKDEDT